MRANPSHGVRGGEGHLQYEPEKITTTVEGRERDTNHSVQRARGEW